MKVLITRALEDAAPLAAELAEKGVESLTDPMLTIEDIAGPPVDLGGVQGLLMTSANGVRAFARRNHERHLPVYAVGDATMREAVSRGFVDVDTASGDVAALANRVRQMVPAGQGVLLHCAGTSVAGDLADRLGRAGYRYRREVLYRARAAEQLQADTVAALGRQELAGVLLYSPRTAAIFNACAARSGSTADLAHTTAFCLSNAVAEAAREAAWHAVKIASAPSQKALLEIVLDGV